MKAKKFLLTVCAALFLFALGLLAACGGKTVSLRFETDGGTAIEAIVGEAGEDISAKLPADPQKDGFTFAGWYLDAEGTGEKQTLPATMPETDTTYYAKWTAKAQAALKLTTGEGGTLAATDFSVYEGTLLKDFLADKTPTGILSGLTFAGWYNGNVKLADDAVMPATALTLTAKYSAPYTVAVWRQGTDKTYVKDAEPIEGAAVYGEAFSFANVFETPEHFHIDNAESDLDTTKVGLTNEFTLYLARDVHRVSFDAALEGTEEMDGFNALYGETFAAPAEAFKAPSSYRFAGWKQTGDAVEFNVGENVTVSGDVTLTAVWEEGIVDFFKQSEDYLFVSLSKNDQNVLYLRRVGSADLKGTFDAATNVFAFKSGDTEVLGGKLLGDGFFYYFKDLQGKTAISGAGDGLELRFGDHDKVDLVQSAADPAAQAVTATTEQGVYTVDTATGEYIFEGKQGTNFHFALNTQAGELVFNRPTDETHRGFYAYQNSEGTIDPANLLFLDGMVDENGVGGMLAGVLEDGIFRPSFGAFYAYEEEYDRYAVMLPSYDPEEGPDYYFRLGDHTGKAGEIDLKGAFQISDGYQNVIYPHFEELDRFSREELDEYLANLKETDPQADLSEYDDYEVRTKDLILDGFGGATLGTQKGTYTIKQFTLTAFDSANGRYRWTDEWLEVTIGSQTKLVKVVSSLNYGYYYIELEKAPYLEQWVDSPAKIYGVYDGSLPQHAAFYHFGGGNVYVFVWYHDVLDDVDVYEQFDYGTIQEKNGATMFVSVQFSYFGEEDVEEDDELFEYKFVYDESGHVHVAVPTIMELYNTNDGKLTTDEWGDLTYDGKKYAYGEWSVSTYAAYWLNTLYEAVNEETDITLDFEIYEFTLGEGADQVTVYAKQGTRADTDPDNLGGTVDYFEILGEDELVDLAYKLFYDQDIGFDRIHFFDLKGDTVEDGGRAAIMLTVLNDTEYESMFVISGSYEKYKEKYPEETYMPDDLYVFTWDVTTESEDAFYQLADLAGEENEELLIAYGIYEGEFSFRFSKLNGKTVVALYTEDMVMTFTAADEATLTLNGTGKATYTPKDGTPVEGDVELLTTLDTESEDETRFLFSFKTETETKFYVLSVGPTEDGDYAYTFADAGADAGVYYALTLYEETDELVTYPYYYLVFDGEGNAFNFLAEADGTYEKTGETVSLYSFTWTEYTVSFRVLNPKTHGYETETYNIIVTQIPDGTMAYIERNEAQVLNFNVSGGGSLKGDGYSQSTFTRADDAVFYGDMGRITFNFDSPIGGNAGSSTDPEGEYVLFHATSFRTNGQTYLFETPQSFLFHITGDAQTTVELCDNFTGVYALYKDGKVDLETLLVIDGLGNATVKTAGQTKTGEYQVLEEGGEYLLAFRENGEGGEAFSFNLGTCEENGTVYYIYSRDKDERAYVNSDWSALILSTIGRFTSGNNAFNAAYVDPFGKVYRGLYSLYTPTLAVLQTTDGKLFFALDADGKSFTHDESEFVVYNGVLYGYQGPSSIVDLKIPDGVTEIYTGVFSGLTYIGGTLDFNDVVKIGDYAFAYIGGGSGAQSDFSVHKLSSENVEWVGDYAFAADDGSVTPILYSSWVNTINFPKATHIGNYAFAANNQLRLDPDVEKGENPINVILGAVEFIGDHAFSINLSRDLELADIDLTKADYSKLTIHKDAFAIGFSSYDHSRLPVTLHVSGIEALNATCWTDDMKAALSIDGYGSDDPFKDAGFYDFENNNVYYEFGGTGEVGGVFSVTRYEAKTVWYTTEWTFEKNWALYGVKDGKIELFTKVADQWTKSQMELKEDSLVFDDSAYRTGVEQTFEITESGKTDKVELKFTLSVFAQIFEIVGDVDVSVSFENLTYGGKADKYNNPSFMDGTLRIEYDEDAFAYRIEVDLAAQTSKRYIETYTVYTADKSYRATFSSWYSDAKTLQFSTMKTLEKKDETGDTYTMLSPAFSSGVPRKNGENGTYLYVLTVTGEGGKETNYTVTYTPAENSATITVNVTSQIVVRDVATKAGASRAYKATFKTNDSTLKTVDELVSLYDEKAYGNITGETTHPSENTFVVTPKAYSSAVTTYTVVYHPAEGEEAAYIEVTKQTLEKKTNVSSYQDGDYEWYIADIWVDQNGDVVSIASLKSYDDYSDDGFTLFTEDMLSDSKREVSGNDFIFTVTVVGSGTQYKITVTKSGDSYFRYTLKVEEVKN